MFFFSLPPLLLLPVCLLCYPFHFPLSHAKLLAADYFFLFLSPTCKHILNTWILTMRCILETLTTFKCFFFPFRFSLCSIGIEKEINSLNHTISILIRNFSKWLITLNNNLSSKVQSLNVTISFYKASKCSGFSVRMIHDSNSIVFCQIVLKKSCHLFD